ncbi:MAG: response regulator [Deltaproteobacteria bacterium]|nr:response regulator [Deltaproteobacteria bacterium]
MKTLIVEDDFTSRFILQEILGTSHVAVNGVEAISAVKAALEENKPYDLICLDIMMPEMDGQQALVEIRRLEKQHGFPLGKGAKVLMTTALSDRKNILKAFREQCDGYIVKPIDENRILKQLKELRIVKKERID